MGGYDKDGPIDDASAWACDCIVSLSIVSASDYPYKPDSKDLAQAIHTRDLEIDSLRARIAELEAERAELVKDRERLRDLVRDAWMECYVHTALDDVKTDPMCLAGLEMEAIEDWGESTARSRLDAARETADD